MAVNVLIVALCWVTHLPYTPISLHTVGIKSRLNSLTFLLLAKPSLVSTAKANPLIYRHPKQQSYRVS